MASGDREGHKERDTILVESVLIRATFCVSCQPTYGSSDGLPVQCIMLPPLFSWHDLCHLIAKSKRNSKYLSLSSENDPFILL